MNRLTPRGQVWAFLIIATFLAPIFRMAFITTYRVGYAKASEDSDMRAFKEYWRGYYDAQLRDRIETEARRAHQQADLQAAWNAKYLHGSGKVLPGWSQKR